MLGISHAKQLHEVPFPGSVKFGMAGPLQGPAPIAEWRCDVAKFPKHLRKPRRVCQTEARSAPLQPLKRVNGLRARQRSHSD
jgi:hypothetical protein